MTKPNAKGPEVLSVTIFRVQTKLLRHGESGGSSSFTQVDQSKIAVVVCIIFVIVFVMLVVVADFAIVVVAFVVLVVVGIVVVVVIAVAAVHGVIIAVSFILLLSPLSSLLSPSRLLCLWLMWLSFFFSPSFFSAHHRQDVKI